MTTRSDLATDHVLPLGIGLLCALADFVATDQVTIWHAIGPVFGWVLWQAARWVKE